MAGLLAVLYNGLFIAIAILNHPYPNVNRLEKFKYRLHNVKFLSPQCQVFISTMSSFYRGATSPSFNLV